MRIGKIVFAFLFLSSLYGCIGTQYLKDDEKLLFKQKIKISRQFDNYEMEQLLAQRPNRRLPVLRYSPYVWFYQKGSKRYNPELLKAEKIEIDKYYDSLLFLTQKPRKIKQLNRKRTRKISKLDLDLKEGNLLMRWGAPLAVYDTNLTKTSLDRLKLYLVSKGYFNAEINHSAKIIGKKINSKFIIKENTPYSIDTLYTLVYDNHIDTLLKNRESLILNGDNYDQETLSDERDQITNYLNDKGYYDFSRQYIRFDVDSTLGNNKVAIRFTILNPLNNSGHKVFTVDKVNFITDAQVNFSSDSARTTELFNGINYRSYESNYKPKILDRRIFLNPDSLYSRSNTLATQRQLANLDVFKFINIKYDSTGSNFVANIFTRPLPRHQWTNEFGVNVTQQFPGPFYNTTLKRRNLFRGLENLELSGRIGFEGVASVDDVDKTYSFETGINASIIFPQFVMPFSKNLIARFGSQNPKTRFRVGYSLIDRAEYKRNNLNFSSVYTWQRQQQTTFSLSAADISLINSEITEKFQLRLDSLEKKGSKLYKSFEPSFVSSVIMQASRSFNNYGAGKSRAAYLRLLVESGGVSHFVVNPKIYEERNLETYQFVKLNLDFRRTRPLINQAIMAFRINTGIALPYGENNALPYEKYFFAGGSNGIRGWRPRRLGPGSYNHIDPETNSLSYQSEQQGEILFEASLEFRQKLFGFVDWAYFIDAGNIWTIDDDQIRPGSEFKIDRFYKEIAIASGFGIRFDFTFLIIRFDAGLKIYDPARPLTKRFILNEGFNDFPFDNASKTEPVILNIGIGYPF